MIHLYMIFSAVLVYFEILLDGMTDHFVPGVAGLAPWLGAPP